MICLRRQQPRSVQPAGTGAAAAGAARSLPGKRKSLLLFFLLFLAPQQSPRPGAAPPGRGMAN